MDKSSTWQLVGICAAGVGVVALAAKYGQSNSDSTSSPSVSDAAIASVTSAAATEHGQDNDLSIAKVQAAANTLVSLKSLEEQVQLGEISLQEAQAQYASQQAIADAGFANQVTIDNQNNAAATRQAQIAGAASNKNASTAGKTNVWDTIIGAITSLFGKH